MERLLTELGEPEFSVTKRKAMPTLPHFVYIVRTTGDRIIYVGQTKHPSARLVSHKKAGTWWEHMRRVDFYRCQSRREALDLELSLIRELMPEYNVMANPLPSIIDWRQRNRGAA